MGPQLVSCGCYRRTRLPPCRIGFNGAAARELRMRAPRLRLHPAPPRFNGAAARELRMRHTQPQSQSSVSGFNGAAARELRMLAVDDPLCRLARASMGPQLVSCGCGSRRARRSECACFNGAAARELRMRLQSHLRTPSLARFNGAAARELRMPSGVRDDGQAEGASMGPQLVSCGCARRHSDQ